MEELNTQNNENPSQDTQKPELKKDMLVSTLVAFYPELTEP